MRTVILTTDTIHHRHFIRAIQAVAPVERVLEETRPAAVASFETKHPFEVERDRHEAEVWFGGAPPRLDELAPVQRFASMNQPKAVAALRAARPDMVVIFGTGILRPEILSVCPDGFLNLHGGDPEEYRGLDTHLWAIYHGDFAGLVTTLHRVAPTLDTGDIVGRMPVPLAPGMDLSQLRRSNTEVCVKLVEEALNQFKVHGQFAARPQRQVGRYYSFMPSVLKEICLHRFLRHTSRR